MDKINPDRFAGRADFVFLVKQNIVIPILGSNAHSDPREISTIIGSALGGPPAAIIIGFLSGLPTQPNIRFASIFAHILSALFVSLIYNYFLYKFKSYKFLFLWAITVAGNFYLVLIPSYLLGLLIFHTPPQTFLSQYLIIANGAKLEFFYTVLFTTAFIGALPKNLRKPIFHYEY